MTKQFSTTISSHLSITTILVEGEGWQIQFIGAQADKELDDYKIIQMWDESVDPEGKHAKKVHDQAVALLTTETPLEKAHLEIASLIEQISDEIELEE